LTPLAHDLYKIIVKACGKTKPLAGLLAVHWSPANVAPKNSRTDTSDYRTRPSSIVDRDG
jgi:hypothetical protein